MESIMRMFSLEGQTAVVTGGTRGIGAAMAIALAEAGADVILIQLGRKAQIVCADLSSQSSVGRIIPSLAEANQEMDILLTSAGIQSRYPAHEFTDSDWNTVLQVNLTAVITLCRDFGSYLLSKPLPESGRRGAIINIGSILSFQGGVTVPAYAASKGGVAQLNRALSNEWAGRGINVNAIEPGCIDTEMNTALMADGERQRSILSRIPAGQWGMTSWVRKEQKLDIP